MTGIAARLDQASQAIADAAAAGCGPATPRADREPAIRKLQQAGCTRQQIADLFGVARETIGQQIGIMRARERGEDRHETSALDPELVPYLDWPADWEENEVWCGKSDARSAPAATRTGSRGPGYAAATT